MVFILAHAYPVADIKRWSCNTINKENLWGIIQHWSRPLSYVCSMDGQSYKLYYHTVSCKIFLTIFFYTHKLMLGPSHMALINYFPNGGNEPCALTSRRWGAVDQLKMRNNGLDEVWPIFFFCGSKVINASSSFAPWVRQWGMAVFLLTMHKASEKFLQTFWSAEGWPFIMNLVRCMHVELCFNFSTQHQGHLLCFCCYLPIWTKMPAQSSFVIFTETIIQIKSPKTIW